jgi:hypothetical protein
MSVKVMQIRIASMGSRKKYVSKRSRYLATKLGLFPDDCNEGTIVMRIVNDEGRGLSKAEENELTEH